MQTAAEKGEMPMERYDEKFDRVDERFDDVDREFKRVDRRFDEVDREFKRVDRRFDEVDRRIIEGREETKQRFDRVEGDVAEVKGTLNRILIGLVLGFLTLLGTVLAVLGTVLVKGA